MRLLIVLCFMAASAYTQTPKIEPGVSHELAKWRAAHYSDVRYKLDLTLEKMSPVLKGTIEVRVFVRDAGTGGRGDAVIVLDWRKIRGHEEKSGVANVSINGTVLSRSAGSTTPSAEAAATPPIQEGSLKALQTQNTFEESNEHLIFRDGVIAGENVIKLDFTSPILTSGSAITRYVDKEDGAEYIYSLFVPSDASTAFPVFDQPDLKAKIRLRINAPLDWSLVTNTDPTYLSEVGDRKTQDFHETKSISTYVFAFAAGRFSSFGDPHFQKGKFEKGSWGLLEPTVVYVRRSQAEKFKPHAAEVFRVNREGVKFLEEYFDYKFPFPKYDIVLIPEFPFGGMEHAGATFLREDRVIFPQEPTKNDYITRANVIFHEAAHQWFGDTVTMRWFDDLWLKEGFAEFMAYKTPEKVMPEYNAWKVFYERNKQAAYLTDSTKGTTPIYQEIKNLSAAKSAYGNIVYRKAPSFLKQAEFYIGPDKFQTAVRAFLKKHEFANAGWEDLVKEFEVYGKKSLTDSLGMKASEVELFHRGEKIRIQNWAKLWVWSRGASRLKLKGANLPKQHEFFSFEQTDILGNAEMCRPMKFKYLVSYRNALRRDAEAEIDCVNEQLNLIRSERELKNQDVDFIFPNYQDYGYGIFLLDDKSREYVLKNIQNEKDEFLRSMMWGALWDSVRESELDPKEYVELVIRNLSTTPSGTTPSAEAAATPPKTGGESDGTTPSAQSGAHPSSNQEGSSGATPPKTTGESDESTIATLLNRVSTAMTHYISDPPPLTGGSDLQVRIENLLIDKMRRAPTLGQRITYYRAFLNVASSTNARKVLKEMLRQKSEPGAVATGSLDLGSGIADRGSAVTQSSNPHSAIRSPQTGHPAATAPGSDLPLKTKDKFDIVTRLLVLNDPEAPKLLADLEKSETSDEAKRYAYAARAGIATKENKAKYWSDFTANKEISESWIEAAFGPFNSVRHADLTLPYLEHALKELPNHKRNRKIFFVNGWLGAFIGGQRSEEALAIVNKFLADNPNLDRDLRLKILENVDLIERAVKIRTKFGM